MGARALTVLRRQGNRWTVPISAQQTKICIAFRKMIMLAAARLENVSMAKAKGSGPLSGVRVIDLTAMVMGPYCTQIMADMGADVIKIEPPAGDNTRYISVGPSPGMSGVFVNVNRGKRSVVLDLRSEEGKAALQKLVEGADVFIHSMRANAIAHLRFGY